MNDVLLLAAGLALGTYFAEPIREVVPVLAPTKGDEGEEAG